MSGFFFEHMSSRKAVGLSDVCGEASSLLLEGNPANIVPDCEQPVSTHHWRRSKNVCIVYLFVDGVSFIEEGNSLLLVLRQEVLFVPHLEEEAERGGAEDVAFVAMVG